MRRRGRKLVTGVTGQEANLMTHVTEVGTDKGARVFDLGGAEPDTVRGGGVLDPGGEIGAGKIDVQYPGHTIEEGKNRDRADRGREAGRKFQKEVDHGLETARLSIHLVRDGTLATDGRTERDPGKEVETIVTAELLCQREISTVQWRH